MPSMTSQAFNVYLSWVCYAVVGQTERSDAILSEHASLVLRGAAAQREAFPVEPKRLYRGILLEDHEVVRGMVAADERLRNVSYSEDLEVAQYFADPETIISGLVTSRKLNVKGYIIERQVTQDRVLFHHSWAQTGILLPPDVPEPWNEIRAIPLGPPASMLLGDDLALQLAFALRTQKEVIRYQDGAVLAVRPRQDLPSPSTQTLNDRYVPPWLSDGEDT